MTSLPVVDWAFVLESLRYTKRAFEDYGGYPSYEFKQARLAEADAVIAAVRTLRDNNKETA